MSRLRILWVGRTERGFVADGVAHYLSRLRPLQPCVCEEVRAASHSGRDPARSLQTEGEALLARLPAEDWVVLLDERGRQFDTGTLAQRLREWQEQAPRVTFVVGGAYGVSDAVRARANQELALSPLTFPHQLVRVILLEQLYRVCSLLAGHGYHHA